MLIRPRTRLPSRLGSNCVYRVMMAGQHAPKIKKKPGPVPTGQGRVVSVRLHPALLGSLDQWIAEQPDPKPTRSEAIRTFLRAGLIKSDVGKY